jgi:tetratricopeptide (TPR) repeat protein
MQDQGRLGQVAAYLTHSFFAAGDPDRAVASAQRALAIAEARGDVAIQIVTHAYLGQVYHALGDYQRAIDVLKRNVASLEGALRREHFGLSGRLSVLSHTWLVWCLAEVGEFAEGIARGKEGGQIAEAAERHFDLIRAYTGVGVLYLRKGDFEQAIPLLERGLVVSEAWNIPVWFPWTAAALGAAYAFSGRVAEALPLLEQAVAQAASMSFMVHQASRVTLLSEAYLLSGRLEEASDCAGQALALSLAHQERGNQAYALRLLGEVAVHGEPPDVAQAETYYRQGLSLADALGMRPLQAHCHLGLGTLYGQAGHAEQARRELSTAIALYRAMEMRFWLPQAEAALAQVQEY